MGSSIDNIKSICTIKERWAIICRISRLWTKSFNDSNIVNKIQMVLVDDQGDMIEAEIPKNLVPKFCKVSEGQVCTIKDFTVIEIIDLEYRYTPHPYMLKFNFHTSLTPFQPSESLNIPVPPLNFVSFNSINESKLDSNYLVDVIGQLDSNPSFEANPKPKFDFVLLNESNERLYCTFWNSYATQLRDIVDNSGEANIIVIVQFGKLKLFKGHWCLNNSMWGTRIICDANCTEVIEFKKRCATKRESGDIQMPTVKTICSQPTDFFKFSSALCVKDINALREPKLCVFVGTVMEIEEHAGWFYDSCKKCIRKLKFTNGYYSCGHCCLDWKVAVPRFRVQIRACDNTGGTSLVMFEPQVRKITWKSVTTLKNQFSKDNGDEIFLDVFNVLIGKKYLFSVDVSSFSIEHGTAFTIKDMTLDERMISDVEKKIQESKVEPIDSMHDELEIDSYTPDVAVSGKTLSKHGRQDTDVGKAIDNANSVGEGDEDDCVPLVFKRKKIDVKRENLDD